MPRYVALIKLTEHGIKDIKSAPQRLADATGQMEAMGGKMLDFYLTMGEYDYVAIADFPSEEAGMTFLMALGAQGNVRTTTLRAFDMQQFADLVSKLP